MENKVWSNEEIKEMLYFNPRAVERAVMAIFKLQTTDEKRFNKTNHNNGLGFNGVDAPILSSFAKWLNTGRHLSQKQMAIAKKKIIKYSGQLTKIANKEI